MVDLGLEPGLLNEVPGLCVCFVCLLVCLFLSESTSLILRKASWDHSPNTGQEHRHAILLLISALD